MDERIKKIKEDLKSAISDFCRYRMDRENPCEEYSCDDCPMQQAYYLAVDFGEEEEEENE